MPDAPNPNLTQSSTFGWKHTFLLIGLILAARIIFLRFFCHFELVGDEAQYWGWAQHPDWSYYTKGPGIAWTIWLTTKIFGNAEWAVRIGAPISAAVTMLAMAGLACDVSASSQKPRAAFYGAFSYLLFLIGLGLALLITIDSPYMACWALAAWAAWRAAQAMSQGKSGFLPWTAFGLALGAGFLYKYTALLIVPGIAAYLFYDRKRLTFSPRAWLSILFALALVLLAMLPVVIWNSNHHWVTIKHLFGHLQIKGGDTTVTTQWSFNPFTLIEYIGTQLGVVGPLTAALITYALYKVWKPSGPSSPQTTDPSPQTVFPSPNAFLIACAAPILLFYLLVSIKRTAEANWPIAGYITLLVLVASQAPAEFDRLRAATAQWLADGKPSTPRRGFLRAKPETLFQVFWHWAVGTSVVVFIGIFTLGLLLRFEFMRTAIPTWRISGMSEAGQAIQAVHDQFSKQLAEASPSPNPESATPNPTPVPFLMASGYETTALLTYYTPGRPVYVCGASLMGQRESSYDFFPDTNWRNPDLIGRPVVLAGTATEERWRSGFLFEDLQSAGFSQFPGTPEKRKIRIFTAKRFLGPRKPSDTTAPSQPAPPTSLTTPPSP
jgi:4-amino-4-deoxy-L-arabinose transferase-like glycosyltransferase